MKVRQSFFMLLKVFGVFLTEAGACFTQFANVQFNFSASVIKLQN